MNLLRVCCALTLALAASASERIDLIEFFGYRGLDVDAVRKALPLREGGNYNDKMKAAIREAVKHITGGEATDIAGVCCNEQHHSALFIGLPGKSTRPFRLNAKPTGAVRLAKEFQALLAKMDKAVFTAIKKGGDAPQEDDSNGYFLIHDPAGHKLQLQMRDYVRAHEAALYEVLENCSDNGQRQQAAVAIEYAQRSSRQVAALLHASHDPDAGVRDESTRALGVLARSGLPLASPIPAADFIEMCASGNWMDRNKASMVLDSLTQSRDPQLLAQVKQQAWEDLMEMARWRDTGHALWPRLILGRIRGIPDNRLLPLADGSPETFLEALVR
ncbi:MAG: hypothetical protein WBY44_33555 [Bryobacteraceae bacterium]